MAETGSYDEALLLQQIAEGNETAFRKLFAIYVPFLQPTLRRILTNDDVSDDIIQETFIRIWIHRDKLPGIENPRSWVLRIAYYRAFNYMRNLQVRAKALETFSRNKQVEGSELDDTLAFKALSKLVSTAVSQLPEQQRKIYRLNREHGMSISEIATQLSLSPQTVKNTLGRAMIFIRDFIEKNGYLLSVLPLIIARKNIF